MKGELLRIVPPEAGDGPMRAMGTTCWVGNQRLAGVTKIELVADCNDVWRATVHLLPRVPELVATMNTPRRSSLWERLRYVLLG